MSKITAEIELHMARAFFASAWADQVEENDSVNLSGKEIMSVMPDEIDPAAIRAARTLRFDMERKNGKPIDQVLAHAIHLYDGGDRPATAEYFGHYCATQAMGHGVGLYDAFGKTAWEVIRVPYIEFGSHSLERDYV